MQTAAVGRVAAAVVGVAATLLLVTAVFASGGSGDPGLLPVGVLALTVVAGMVAASLWGRVPLPRVGRPGAALLASSGLLAVWIALSVSWSIEPDRSWAVFNRAAVYLAVLGLGIFLGGLVPRPARVLAVGLAAVLGGAAVWALATVVVPALGPDLELERSARLREPVGYWNALALLLAMSVPLWLWAAARHVHGAWVRAAAVGALVPVLVAIALTSSRGGVLVTAVAAGVWLALGGPRVEGAIALLVGSVAALPAAWWGLAGSDLLESGVYDARERDGAVLGLLVLVSAVVAALVARVLVRRRLSEAERRRVGRGLAVAAAAVGVVSVVAFAATGTLGERLDEFRNPPSVQVTQGPRRVVSFSSNHRWTWWGEAWRIAETHALAGTGAGSFELARRPLREDTQAPMAPHNVALQALAETGVVGLVLLLLVAASIVVAVWAGLRRLGGEEGAAAAALAAACAGYGAHSLIDMAPEYVAVTVPFLLALGVLTSAGRGVSVRDRRAPLGAAAVAVGAVTLLVSLGMPWLADRRLDDAADAAAGGDLARADERAESAHGLNPFSIEPLLLRGAIAEARGAADAAERFYVEAAELQPESPEPWYELGRFTYEVRHNPGRALEYLDRSYAIDNFHPAGPALLVVVRRDLEGG